MSTMRIESTPSCDISLIYPFINIRIRSGTEKVLFMSMRYLPKVTSELYINMV